MEVSEGDIVLIRIDGQYGKTNTWWNILTIDTEYFYGSIYSSEPFSYIHKGNIVKFKLKDIQRVLQPNDEFCYSDNVTICDCPGLCRNK